MTDPLKILDEVEHGGWVRNGLPAPYSETYRLTDDPVWQSLRAAIEAREERIKWLEAQVKAAMEFDEKAEGGE